MNGIASAIAPRTRYAGAPRRRGDGTDPAHGAARLAPEEALTSALYDHLLKFPATARFFVKEDGSPDRERIERRKHSLVRWLRGTADIAMREGASYYVLGVALSHSHRDTNAPAARYPRGSWSAR